MEDERTLSDLDIEELEARLELAAATPIVALAPADWTIGVGHRWDF